VEPVAPPKTVRDVDRPTAHAGRFDRAAVLGLALVIGCYVAVASWLLIVGELRPYVYDNNESYSSFWHGYNLYHFGLRSGAGLADESFSPHAGAHPFVHTHQGNVPRLFSFALYALGLRTVEAHIVATTFTLGLLSVVLAFAFFRVVGGTLFATITGLLMATDYVFVAQWSVVTYRVWHGLLLFGALLAVTRRAAGRRRLDDAMLFLCSVGLFYYELVFAAFAGLTVVLFAAWWHRAERRTLAWLATLMGAGAAVSVGVLVVQLVSFLGWSVAARDFYLTFLARNVGSKDAGSLAALDRFYQSNPIVFWYNLVDTAGFRLPERFAQHVLSAHFQVYTPLLTLLVLLTVGGWLLGMMGARVGRVLSAASALTLNRVATYRRTSNQVARLVRTGFVGDVRTRLLRLQLRADVTPSPGLTEFATRASSSLASSSSASYSFVSFSLPIVPSAVVAAIVGLGSAAYQLAVARDTAFLGRSVPSGWSSGMGPAIVAAVITITLYVMWRRRSPDTAPSLRTTLGIGGCLLVVALVVRRAVGLYDQAFAPLWYEALSLWLPTWLSRAGVFAATAVGTTLLLRPDLMLDRRTVARLVPLVAYLAAGFGAFVVIYYLSPGYVVSGYLRRSAPLLVFVAGPLLGLALTLLVLVAWQALRRHPCRHGVHDGMLGQHQSGRLGLAGRRALGLAAAGTAVLFVVQWGHTQLAYAQLLPPTQFAWLGQLAEPPLAGKTSVSNMYGAPIAAYTGEWSYVDQTIGRVEIREINDSPVVAQELQTYVWFADRGRNPAYARPDVYVCMRQQGMTTALARVTGDYSAMLPCENVPLVALAASGGHSYLGLELVGRDPSPLDSWAIVALDWHFPPFLKPRGTGVYRRSFDALLADGPAGSALTIDYDYRQADGDPEADTRVRVEGLGTDGRRCLLAERTGGGALPLPANLRGPIRASVTPRSATKAGAEYVSDSLVVVDADADPCQNR